MADDGTQFPRIPPRLRDWEELNRRVAALSEYVLSRLEAHVALTPPDYAEDPHPQYFHLVNDTAWAGMRLTSDLLLTPGDLVAPYDLNLYDDWHLTSNLTNGSIAVPSGKSGGYQVSIYFAFQAASNGGTFFFELFVDGVESGFATVSNLSNQSDLGTGVLVAFLPIDVPVGPDKVIDLRFGALSSKNVTMLDVVWTMYRVFPSEGDLS